MAVNAQAVVAAMIRALEAPPHEQSRLRRPVITVSRTLASRGDEIAHALARGGGLDELQRPLVDLVQIRVPALGEGAQKVQGRRRLVIGVEHAAGIGAAPFRVRLDRVHDDR